MPSRAPKKRTYRSKARRSPELKRALKAMGSRVRALRKAREMTQEDLAASAGLDPKHLQEIEAGRVNVTVATLLGLAQAMEVGVAALLEE